jgi:hypothetical protein
VAAGAGCCAGAAAGRGVTQAAATLTTHTPVASVVRTKRHFEDGDVMASILLSSNERFSEKAVAASSGWRVERAPTLSNSVP